MFKAHYYDVLASTNKKAKEFDGGNAIIAASQTQGKGRLRRRWSSSRGGIYMSIVLKPEIKNINKLTIMAARAVQKTLKKSGVTTKIKFPNDLQYKGKKICGILTENIFKNNEIEKMVIGIGINTNNNLPKSLNHKAITLKKILKRKVDNKKMVTGVLREFSFLYGRSIQP